MPFDSAPTPTELTPRKRGYQLARELRDLPASHEWDFVLICGRDECESGGCAVGYAKWRWPEIDFGDPILDDNYDVVGSRFGLTPAQASSCFSLHLARELDLAASAVTPHHVADAIERALDEGGAP